MAAISQMTFSSAFSRKKMFEFRLKFHWSFFLRVQLTIFQHWFRQWLGAGQAASHCLNQWWLVYWRIYASLGLHELRHTYWHLKNWFDVESFLRIWKYQSWISVHKRCIDYPNYWGVLNFLYLKTHNLLVVWIQFLQLIPWRLLLRNHHFSRGNLMLRKYKHVHVSWFITKINLVHECLKFWIYKDWCRWMWPGWHWPTGQRCLNSQCLA